jgi:RNA polymerase-binding transcription factor DksA
MDPWKAFFQQHFNPELKEWLKQYLSNASLTESNHRSRSYASNPMEQASSATIQLSAEMQEFLHHNRLRRAQRKDVIFYSENESAIL